MKTTKQLILLDRSELEAMALEAVSATMYYELHDTIDEADDIDLMRVIMFGGNYAYERAYQAQQEQQSYSDYITEGIELGTTSISAFEWRQLERTR